MGVWGCAGVRVRGSEYTTEGPEGTGREREDGGRDDALSPTPERRIGTSDRLEFLPLVMPDQVRLVCGSALRSTAKPPSTSAAAITRANTA